MAKEHDLDDGADLPKDLQADPEFNDELPPEADPEQQEFRDTERVHKVIAGEDPVSIERAIDEDNADRRTIDILEAMRELEYSDEIEWRITRVGCDDPEENGYLEQWPNSSMSLERLRRYFGGGKYRLHGMRRGRYITHKTIKIAGKPIPRAEMGKPKDAAPAPGQQFDVLAFLAQQTGREERLRREMDDRDEKRRREEEDARKRAREERNELLKILAPIAASVLPGMFGRRESMTDMIQALAAMKQLEPQPVPQEDSTDKIFKVVDMLKELGLGAGEGKTDLWDIAKEVIKQMGPGIGQGLGSIAQMIAARQQAAPGQPAAPGQMATLPSSPVPAPPALPAPTAAVAAPAPFVPASQARSTAAAQPVTQSPAIDPQKAQDMGLFDLLPLASHLPWLKGHIENLIVRAARQSNPELYAELMLDDFPQNADVRVLGQLLARHDWFTLVKQLDVRVAQYQPWFEAFRVAILGMIQEETGINFGIQTDTGIDERGRQTIRVDGGEHGGPADGGPAGGASSETDSGE